MFYIFTADALCNSNLFTALWKRKKIHLIYNKHKLSRVWVELCTNVNNIAVHIGTEHTT